MDILQAFSNYKSHAKITALWKRAFQNCFEWTILKTKLKDMIWNLFNSMVNISTKYYIIDKI